MAYISNNGIALMLESPEAKNETTAVHSQHAENTSALAIPAK
ncbi:hypothetical protein [Vibrio ezurae]|nr:hypothetical protein [Vibrio ezurae]